MTAAGDRSVGVIDVGSNTVRLLVARRGAGAAVVPVHEDRDHLRLGEEVERRGEISAEKLAATAATAARLAAGAREAGADELVVVVTAPGRQSANAAALLAALEDATGEPARVLSADEEGRLAYLGALATGNGAPRPLAVCDVGGGSTELVVGSGTDPAFARSVDIGSLRLTLRHLHDDPPSRKQLGRARDAVEELFADVNPPRPAAAMATGGTARALRRLVGQTLGQRELSRSLDVLARSPSGKLPARYGVDPGRARYLPAGAVILREMSRRVDRPFGVAQGGIREGLAATMLGCFDASPDRDTNGTAP